MCGRVVWRWDPALEAWVKEFLGEEAPEGSRPWLTRSRYNIAPTQPLPIAVESTENVRAEHRRADGAVRGRDVLEVDWGVQRPGGGLAINARVESLRSPMWRELAPCLVPVSGFYEWSHEGPRPVPHFIRRKDGAAMVLAGLWTEVAGGGPGEGAMEDKGPGAMEGVGNKGVRGVDEGVGGGALGGARCAIVTCPPVGPVDELHDRMPVVLGTTHAWEAWLRERRLPEGTPPMVYHQVGMDVNRSDATGPRLIEPARAWF